MIPYHLHLYFSWTTVNGRVSFGMVCLGLQPEKNKLVFFGKKNGFFREKKHILKKTGQNFVFFIFKHLFTFYCFLNDKKWLTVLILCLELG